MLEMELRHSTSHADAFVHGHANLPNLFVSAQQKLTDILIIRLRVADRQQLFGFRIDIPESQVAIQQHDSGF